MMIVALGPGCTVIGCSQAFMDADRSAIDDAYCCTWWMAGAHTFGVVLGMN